MLFYFDEDMKYIGEGESTNFVSPIFGYTALRPSDKMLLAGCKFKYGSWDFIDTEPTEEEFNVLWKEHKEVKLKEIKEAFKRASVKPKVEVRLSDDLTVIVDGGRTNKDDFKEEWESMADDETTTVKDANNEFHTDITKDQMQKIYKAIVTNGKVLFQNKWTLEALVSAAETVEEVEAIKW